MWGNWRIPGKSSLFRARRRLGSKPLRVLFAATVRPLGDERTPGAFWRGWPLMAVDGGLLGRGRYRGQRRARRLLNFLRRARIGTRLRTRGDAFSRCESEPGGCVLEASPSCSRRLESVSAAKRAMVGRDLAPPSTATRRSASREPRRERRPRTWRGSGIRLNVYAREVKCCGSGSGQAESMPWRWRCRTPSSDVGTRTRPLS